MSVDSKESSSKEAKVEDKPKALEEYNSSNTVQLNKKELIKLLGKIGYNSKT